jgi:ribosomal-protein-alanine N-acetyltransferase
MKGRLRPAARVDVPAVVAIESATFPCPWSEGTFYVELDNDVSKFKVLTLGDEVIGYYDLWICGDEAHLLNVAVAEPNRRRGYGEVMLQDAMSEAQRARCVRIVLEVRTSNVPAIGLYEKFGFKKVGQRPRYYADGENADIMVKDF